MCGMRIGGGGGGGGAIRVIGLGSEQRNEDGWRKKGEKKVGENGPN